MGRRSINTTKSGKYMNPTDQARKEARKRELKKNKKQRQMVRAAVLKGKDPLQILSDMEKIDEMEYSVVSPPLLNEKVLKDKRKKLKETWDRVMRLYLKEDRERYLELKKLEIEYETKRSELMRYFESVRVTQQVQVDEIPLPSTPNMPSFLTSQIPLPNELDLPPDLYPTPHSILKKGSAYFRREAYSSLNQPPGVPPGPPPDLSSDEEELEDEGTPMETDSEVSKKTDKTKSRKIRFADENTPSLNDKDDDNDDDDEEEEEVDGKPTEPTEKSTEASEIESAEVDFSNMDKNLISNPEDIPVPPLNQVPLPAGPPPRMPQGPPPMMFRPPPLRPGMPPPPRLLPPGVPPPPPGRHALPPLGMSLRLGAPPIRLPPGPPPGIPPLRLVRPLSSSLAPPRLSLEISQAASQLQSASAVSAVLSAPPSLMQRPKNTPLSEEETKRAATIEAKPQIRNLSADVMRFMPTTLRVKREDRHKKGGKAGLSYESSKETYSISAPVSNPSASVPTKDDAYQQFLREMEEFL